MKSEKPDFRDCTGLEFLTFVVRYLLCTTFLMHEIMSLWDTISAIAPLLLFMYVTKLLSITKHNLSCLFQSILRSNSPTDLMDTPLTRAQPRQVTTDLSIAFLTVNTEWENDIWPPELSGVNDSIKETLWLSIKMTWARFTPQSTITRLKNTLKANLVIFTFFLVLQL